MEVYKSLAIIKNFVVFITVREKIFRKKYYKKIKKKPSLKQGIVYRESVCLLKFKRTQNQSLLNALVLLVLI